MKMLFLNGKSDFVMGMVGIVGKGFLLNYKQIKQFHTIPKKVLYFPTHPNKKN
jgi:hypothetical protein